MAAANIGRRDFLKGAAAATGLVILPSGVLAGENAPSNKLNIALIGCDGRARAHYGVLKGENVVALCDVDEEHIAHAAKTFPNAKHYVDWRKCLEQKDLDAVVCCTLDHTHAFIANWAMNRGLHVYCEKPLANTVEEARVVRDTYLKNRGKIATQVGTQRHQYPNFERVRELIRDGAIGELQDARAWGNRQLRKDGYLPGKGKPPKNLHYDLWLGPAQHHPYNPGYFDGRPGANCLNWNMYWDFGTGQVGDMGSHTMDIIWNAIDAGRPETAEAKGEKYDPEVTPVELQMTWRHPANDWRGPINVMWYQGGMMPNSPRKYVNLNRIGHGAMFKGTKGFIVCDFNSRLVIPWGPDADMTYFEPRKEEEVAEPMGHFQREWIDACKGDLKTSCDFDYAGLMIEQMMLGLVAYRAGEKIEYNGETGRTNNAKANSLLAKEYRKGWTLSG
ncbi:Gfo/Idh/MocA family oxidoreductase [Anaerohalosphaera lusitana]|nr:Gfo/Idh/MocA family oxidoreductase [Anaerohalosphaera lusitana]